jgi:hypothetical protein
MVIPPGITSSWRKNSPEEWFSAGNYRLMGVDSDQQNARQVFRTVTIIGTVNPSYFTSNVNLLSKLK